MTGALWALKINDAVDYDDSGDDDNDNDDDHNDDNDDVNWQERYGLLRLMMLLIMMTTVMMIIGTLRSNDADGNENVKRRFFEYFFPVFARLRRENA